MLRILVLWANTDNNTNLGVRVLAEGTAELLREAFGEDVVIHFQDLGLGATGVKFGSRTMLMDMIPGFRPLSRVINGYDLVVDTGAGDSFSDIYGWDRFLKIIYVQSRVRRVGVPHVMGPQTIGPFRTNLARRIAAKTIRNADTLLVRDPRSADVAIELGRRPDAVTPDVVFALPSPAVATTRDVVFNISGLLWHPNPHVNSDTYRKEAIELIGQLTASGRRVTLLPHVVGEASSPGTDNDVAILGSIRAEIGTNIVDEVIPETLKDAREILGSARVVVASRMHACLNAISMGTPAIPLAYSRKFSPLLKDIGWPITIDLREQPRFHKEVTRLIGSKEEMHDLECQTENVRVSAMQRLNQIPALIHRAAAI